MAERAGFEPAVRLPLHTLSKRAPSTARTPLRISGLLIVCRAQQIRKSLKEFPFQFPSRLKILPATGNSFLTSI